MDVNHVKNRLPTTSVVHQLGGIMKPLRAHPNGVVHEDVMRVDQLNVAMVPVHACANASLAARLELGCAVGHGLERLNTGIAAAE